VDETEYYNDLVDDENSSEKSEAMNSRF